MPVSQVIFHWTTSGAYVVQVGLDGTLQAGQSADGVTLSAPLGVHDIRLEVVCEACGVDERFALVGVEIVTVL